jgi:hypothetical protein
MGDTSTLYQTFWASTSVTAPNDPIAAVLDKSRPEQDKTAAFIAGNPTSVTGSSITKSGAVLTLSGSAINDEVKFDPIFAADDTYAYCEFTASGSGQILVYAGGSPVAFTLTGSPVASRASMTSNGSSFLIFRAVSAGATGTITVTKVGARKGNHATQPTAIKRPLYQVVGGYGCAQFDATDDALLFPAITFGGAFNTFVAGKVTGGTVGVHLWRTADSGGGFWGVYQSGAAITATGVNAGSPAYSNNGEAVSPQTRAQVYTLINGVDSVLESIGVVLSAETALQFAGYSGSQFQGNAHRVLMISGTLTAAEKLLCRQWCAEGNGVAVV